MRNPFQIKAAGENEAELLIYGDIGENWYGEGVAAKETAEKLSAMDVETITVRINSYGGSVADGIAIFNALRGHKATINVHVDGVAVSIASLIAMAGDTVKMSENTLFMVHAPWGGMYGNAKELREYADVLDTYAEAMASSYVRKTGQDHDIIMALLTDGVDHYYTAADALAFGFVDEILDEEMAAAASGFDQSKFMSSVIKAGAEKIKKTITQHSQTAAPVAATTKQQESTTMTEEEKAAAKKKADEKIAAKATAKEKAAEDKRKADIRSAVKPHMSHDGMQALVDECIDNGDITAEMAKDKVLAKLGASSEPVAGASSIQHGVDEQEKKASAAIDVIISRVGAHRMKGNGVAPMSVDLQGNPFVGNSLMDMARHCLKASGKNPDGMDKREVVAQAFQTTSDFPVILENAMHKVLLAAYTTALDTWSRFCKVGNLSDFRPHNRYRTGSIGNLDSLNEKGEFKSKIVPDGEKGTIQASTKGNIIAITREAIINDDLQALADLFMNTGRAYKRTIEAAVYSLLAENAGLGPTLTDGKTLFHADHGNIGAAAAISMASIEADRVQMAKQKDVGDNDYLDLRPAKLVLPVGLGGTARSINEAQYDPDTPNKLQKPNIVNGLYDDIIDSPRVTGTRRYSFADPDQAPVIEVGFLDGDQEPYIETRDGWSTDGAELKVRGDFGVAAIDYRGAQTNAGA